MAAGGVRSVATGGATRNATNWLLNDEGVPTFLELLL